MSETGASDTCVHPTLDTEWWWKALRQGELLIPNCRDCGSRFFPPQAFCPNCGSRNWHGATTGGTGKIYSWIVTHHAFTPEFSDDLPYAIVAVDLDDGGRLVGRYVGDLDAIRAGLPVRTKVLRGTNEAVLGFEAMA